ncbi:GNAT family N-acetyltransferase [Shewanella salipaludis]|uniref:GNAT family N-acetyltransferase n=1 Tax=Shewanella salipaludis TaxID=2723052 RepID=A0A972FUZ8_9GAMM|nr:GNAT family N-acetyltransferase [Shewanella salipaludis]NMH66132.1 GNAT family N-acetyltransferase [Shewanella salipaludis]
MELRQATSADIGQISALVTELVTKYIAPDCTPEGAELLLNAMTPEAFEGYLAAGYRYHVADIAGAIVGLVGIRDNAHLYHLFVADSHQGQGLSRRLWELAREVALAAGNEGVFTVNSALNAKDVYLRLGFVPLAGVRERAGIRDIPMELRL